MSELTWPKDWMAQGNRAMIACVESDPDWGIECAEIRESMEHLWITNWKELIAKGYRYYVLLWNYYDLTAFTIEFYADPYLAQERFELLRNAPKI